MGAKNLILDAAKASDLNPKKIILVGSVQDVNTECEFGNYYIPLRRRECGFNAESSRLNKLFTDTSKNLRLPKNVYFIYPYEKICENESCTVISGSTSNYSDGAHLTKDGALLVIPDIYKILNE